MNRQQLVQQMRKAIEAILPEAGEETVRLWFCRMCALRYMEVNGLIPDVQHLPMGDMQLFAGCTEFPELLLPAMEYLHRIPETEWYGHPELAGWLYQYYNLPEREAVFAGLRSNVKIPPNRIPAATQLFTPDWIVQYMTQNALGTVCRPLPEWNYYIKPEHPFWHPEKSVTDVRILDPCMGTGHILAYVFDALMGLYLAEGCPAAEAAERILTYHLYGLDIDEGAVRLGEFVLLMKAAQYVPDVSGMKANVFSFSGLDDTAFVHAEVFGSLLRPEIGGTGKNRLISEILNTQYDAVITNPPYMGSSGMSPLLSGFVKKHYPRGKADLFAAFMERCAELTAPDGCFSMITQHAWMFLSSYRELRRMMRQHSLQSMVHLGTKAFSLTDVGTIVQTTAFTALGREVKGLPATYIRLTEQEDKEAAFFDTKLRYHCTAERFAEIPGQPLCYWVSSRMLEVMRAPKLSEFCKICQGMTTSDNKRFLRRWYEVKTESIAFGCRDAAEAIASGKTWFPYNKGGRLRRWYGNHSWVVNFWNDGEELRAFHAVLNRTRCGGRLKNADMYFRPAITWPFITESTRFGVRMQPEGFLFDVSGSCLFPEEGDTLYLAGLLSSAVVLEFLKLFNPTMNFQVENLSSLPVVFDRSHQPEIEALVQENIRIAYEDWNCTEESWDFRVHPLVQYGVHDLAEALQNYQDTCKRRISAMQRNEEALNRIFAEIYGLTEELDCCPPETTLYCPDTKEAAEELVSFAVGCLFGRYQANGIPVLSENFLSLQALPAYLTEFLRTIYGEEMLAENIAALEAALGDTLAHYCSYGFYPSHCRKYHKRPIYWLASSGRKRIIHGLCYVHRMEDTPVPLLRQLAEQFPACTELTAYRSCLDVLERSGILLDPDAGIPANHSRFRTIFAAIR